VTEEQNLFGQRPASMPMVYTDPSAIAAAESVKARIQAAYIMAFQKPRNEMQARDAILRACQRTEFAGKAEYEKPIGNIKVRGPSIRFAELALREWGNILSEVQTLYEDEDSKRIRVSVLDLETNAQFSRDVQLKKTIERKSKKGRDDDYISERKNTRGETVYILRSTDEEMYTKESAWVSRVLRNEGLRVIPTDIIEEGMQKARQTLAERVVKDPEGEKKKILDGFSSIGVRPKDIERYINHSLDTISPAELINLRTIYQSIRDGEATWSDYFSFIPDKNTSDSKMDETLIGQFYAMVEKETGRKYQYIENATDPLTTFIKKTSSGQTPPAKPIDFIAVIMKGGEKQFIAFWNAYLQFAEKNKMKEPEAGKDEIENPYDQVDWKSCKLQMKSIINFVRKNDEQLFRQALPTSRNGFYDLWLRRFSDNDGLLKEEFPFAWPVPANAGKDQETDQEGEIHQEVDVGKETEGEDYDRSDELKAIMEQNEELYFAACQELGYNSMVVPDLHEDQKILWDMINELKPQFQF